MAWPKCAMNIAAWAAFDSQIGAPISLEMVFAISSYLA